MNKADRGRCPQGAPSLASLPCCLFAAAQRHPLPFWSWVAFLSGGIFPGAHSRGLFRPANLSRHHLRRWTFILLCAGQRATCRAKASSTSKCPQPRALSPSHHVGAQGTAQRATSGISNAHHPFLPWDLTPRTHWTSRSNEEQGLILHFSAP